MAMATNFFPNLTLSPSNPTTKKLLLFHPSLPFAFHHRTHDTHKRDFSLCALSSIIPVMDMDYFEREFSGRGVSFTSIGDSCVVRMALDNGSVASLMLPSGLITSYKPYMWHGTTIELLHTTVSSQGNDEEDGCTSAAIVQGGVSVAVTLNNCEGLSWSPTTWILNDVRGNSHKSIQVELISGDSEDMVQVKYIVTLQPDVLVSEVVIFNSKSALLELTGTLLSHLAVSTPDATYAIGLEGSNYWSKPPISTDFSIIPPALSRSQTRGKMFNWGRKEIRSSEKEMEGEETDNQLQLTEKMSRIYTSAPRMFEVIDRGRRNSVGVGSDGFDELYMFSPGSSHEHYGKYAYICTGPSAMLKPIILDPQSIWRGVQHLHNPNL